MKLTTEQAAAVLKPLLAAIRSELGLSDPDVTAHVLELATKVVFDLVGEAEKGSVPLVRPQPLPATLRSLAGKVKGTQAVAEYAETELLEAAGWAQKATPVGDRWWYQEPWGTIPQRDAVRAVLRHFRREGAGPAVPVVEPQPPICPVEIHHLRTGRPVGPCAEACFPKTSKPGYIECRRGHVFPESMMTSLDVVEPPSAEEETP